MVLGLGDDYAPESGANLDAELGVFVGYSEIFSDLSAGDMSLARKPNCGNLELSRIPISHLNASFLSVLHNYSELSVKVMKDQW